MADVTMDMIKILREKTGAGIADCKKALTECEGNIETAVENLRKSGIAKAEKKAGRAVKEGRTLAICEKDRAALVEVLCETDFVATNEKFAASVEGIAKAALAMDGDGCVTEKVNEAEKEKLMGLIATIGENMQIRRAAKWVVTGQVNAYLHGGGRIGVMVEADGPGADADTLREICMHIAAYSPSYVTPDQIPAEAVAKEKEIAMALPELASKPEQIREKIASGKINKWYSEICLMQQPWFKEPSTTLEKLKPGLKVKRFLRWSISDEL